MHPKPYSHHPRPPLAISLAQSCLSALPNLVYAFRLYRIARFPVKPCINTVQSGLAHFRMTVEQTAWDIMSHFQLLSHMHVSCPQLELRVLESSNLVDTSLYSLPCILDCLMLKPTGEFTSNVRHAY